LIPSKANHYDSEMRLMFVLILQGPLGACLGFEDSGRQSSEASFNACELTNWIEVARKWNLHGASKLGGLVVPTAAELLKEVSRAHVSTVDTRILVNTARTFLVHKCTNDELAVLQDSSAQTLRHGSGIVAPVSTNGLILPTLLEKTDTAYNVGCGCLDNSEIDFAARDAVAFLVALCPRNFQVCRLLCLQADLCKETYPHSVLLSGEGSDIDGMLSADKDSGAPWVLLRIL
jgi:hypothetical protein